MRKLLFSIIALASLIMMACTNTTQKQEAAEQQKNLVLYYSQEGTTKMVAEEIARLTGADIITIQLEEPYDSDYNATIQRVMKERLDSVLPVVKPLEVNINDYDTIYLGYPIWFGTYAPPMAALLKDIDLEGKTVVPFCSFGSGGLEVSIADLKEAQPKANIALPGYGVRAARRAAIPQEVDRFLKEQGYIQGEVEALPAFSAQEPVTEDEVAIFQAACGDYQFPLGTPVTCGKRTTSDGTDYEFVANSIGMDGNQATTTIYVTASNAEGAKPEFTRVVR